MNPFAGVNAFVGVTDISKRGMLNLRCIVYFFPGKNRRSFFKKRGKVNGRYSSEV